VEVSTPVRPKSGDFGYEHRGPNLHASVCLHIVELVRSAHVSYTRRPALCRDGDTMYEEGCGNFPSSGGRISNLSWRHGRIGNSPQKVEPKIPGRVNRCARVAVTKRGGRKATRVAKGFTNRRHRYASRALRFRILCGLGFFAVGGRVRVAVTVAWKRHTLFPENCLESWKESRR